MENNDIDKNGFSILSHQRPGPNNQTMIRSQFTMKNSSVEAFDRVLKELDESMKTAPHVVEFRVLEKDQDGTPSVMYSLSKMTMMSMRESLIRMQRYPQQDGRLMSVMKSIEHPDFPITDKAIRIFVFKTQMAANVDGNL